jgi:basic amino acid/polyamine antiporter, APA family
LNGSPVRNLERSLGTGSAALLGLGSIFGTGVFVAIGLGVDLAGFWIVPAIVLAGLVAACNALSSAQLAAAFPVSGGTYEYGYRLLHPLAGFSAGWLFLLAKSASAAAAALGSAAYGLRLFGQDHPWIIVATGLVLVLAVTLLVLSGLRRSNIANTLIVALTLIALLAFVIASLPDTTVRLRTVTAGDLGNDAPGWPVFAYTTALIFVAYTGYGRIATMGEEVVTPETTIPRAIIVTLGVSFLTYLSVAICMAALMPTGIARSLADAATPLESAARSLQLPWLSLLVSAGAITAMLGVLLNLVLGLSRVVLAMARRGDLPRLFSNLTGRGNPALASLAVGASILALVLTGNIETVWSFSAFTVLIYYAITNIAAIRLSRAQRRYPRWISAAGLVGCLALAAFIPVSVWLAGAGLMALGLGVRYFMNRRTAAPDR